MFGLFKRKKSAAPAPAAPRVIVEMSTDHQPFGEVLVAGTTTFAREAVEALAQRHNMQTRDMIELPATIERDPNNPVDPRAVAVVVEGEKVGALPTFISHALPISDGVSEPVIYQLWALREDGKRIKAKAHVWIGSNAPVWTYTERHPAPLLTDEQACEKQERARAIAAQNLAPDTPLGRALRSGNMRGYTPIELVEPIQQLKREKRWEEALTMLYAAIESEERARAHGGGMPAPWYTEHAAICHRRLKQHEEEVVVLKRYLAHLTPEQRATSKIQARLTKIENG